jgi:hypothetical protein
MIASVSEEAAASIFSGELLFNLGKYRLMIQSCPYASVNKILENNGFS